MGISGGIGSAKDLPDDDIQQNDGQNHGTFNVVVQAERQDRSDQENKC